MSKPLLVIANKNYSSWSLRAYMALAMAGIAFEEKLVNMGDQRFGRAMRKISGAGTAPILVHRERVIWESLAILEYAAETWPAKNIWPKPVAARALARSACSEMHAGFRALRNDCPMNLRRAVKPLAAGLSEGVMADVKRIEALWAQCRKRHGTGGPFLFGRFSAADAMFTPVATRLETYAIPVGRETQRYMAAVFATPAFVLWKADALKEPWIVPEDDVD